MSAARAAFILWVGAACAVAAPRPAWAETPDPGEPTVVAEPEAEAPADEDEDDAFPVGGTVIYENAVGRGSFLSSAANQRPYWSMWFRVEPHYDVHGVDGLRLALRFDLSVDVIENADSSNTRPNQPQPGDLRLVASWRDVVEWEPIGLGLTPRVHLAFPTSWASRVTTKVLGLHAGLTTTVAPLDWLEVYWSLGFTKNFNLYTNAVLDDGDFSHPPLARAGGAEAVAEGLTATGSAPTSHSLANELGVSATFLEVLSVGLTWQIVNAWTYANYPIDQWSSPHAVAGRGRLDVMVGTIDVTWEVLDYLSLSVGTTTEQAPKTADNTGFRFPFWDTTNGAANRQVFYLDVTGSF